MEGRGKEGGNLFTLCIGRSKEGGGGDGGWNNAAWEAHKEYPFPLHFCFNTWCQPKVLQYPYLELRKFLLYVLAITGMGDGMCHLASDPRGVLFLGGLMQ